MARFSFRDYEAPTMEVEWQDGKTYHILPASKGLMEKMAAFNKTGGVDDLDFMYEIMLDILNSNREGRKFSMVNIDGLGFDTLVDFMTQYQIFMLGDVVKNPN